jgi:hypothetical protein
MEGNQENMEMDLLAITPNTKYKSRIEIISLCAQVFENFGPHINPKYTQYGETEIFHDKRNEREMQRLDSKTITLSLYLGMKP